MKSNELKQFLLVIAVLLVGIGIAYAALSTTLNITLGTVSQSSLTWNVGFDTSGGSTVTAAEGGTSAVGRVCGVATVTANSVTVADTTLSKPDDSCIYTLTVKNSGTIPAEFNTITPSSPSGVSCNPVSGGNMVCGNITYKLASDSTGATTLTTGNVLAASGTQTIYLVAKYTGTEVNSTPATQSGAKFTLNYIQA